MRIRSFCTAVLVLAGVAFTTPASAQNVTLDIFDFGFGNGPSGQSINPTIHPGDTVTWHFYSGFHSTTSDPNQAESWNSTVLGPGAPDYPHTFTNIGDFTYFCQAHTFMQAVIHVVAVPEPGSLLAGAVVVGGMVTGIRRGRARATRWIHSKRNGFTLIELLVCLSIISLLTGLLLSAVQKVRASAGYTSCRNNLKQIGLALNMHEVQFGHYPGIGVDPSPTSALVPLLPFLEQDNLHKSLAPDRPLFLTMGDYVRLTPDHAAAAGTVVPTFLCPNDGLPAVTTSLYPEPVAGTNYVANAGTGTGTNYDFRYPTDGVFWHGSKLRRRDVTDGISSTMFFAEALRGPGPDLYTPTADPQRYWMSVFHMAWPNSDRAGTTPPLSDATCNGTMLYMTMRGDRGVTWIGGPGNRTLFNTYLMPNDPMMDCGSFGLGRFKASSGHAGGANMVLGDGSVHFIKNHIDRDTWRALSTRRDEEVIGSYCGCH